MKVIYKKDFVLEGEAKEIAETIIQLAKREKSAAIVPAPLAAPKKVKKEIRDFNHWNYAQDYFMRQNMETINRRAIHKEVNKMGPKHSLGSVRTRIWQIRAGKVKAVLPPRPEKTLDDILEETPRS